MRQSLSSAEWMEALRDTMNEVATTALNLPACQVSPISTRTPRGIEGAYLALVGQEDAIQIGLTSSAEGCQALSKALLAMAADDADLEPPDVADAMCEIVNIIAGGLKARVHGMMSPIKLGLPIFVKGTVQPSGRIVVLVAEVVAGHIPAALVLIEPSGSESALKA